MIRQNEQPKPMPDTARPQHAPADPRGGFRSNPAFEMKGMIDNGGCWDSDEGECDNRFFDPNQGRG